MNNMQNAEKKNKSDFIVAPRIYQSLTVKMLKQLKEKKEQS